MSNNILRDKPNELASNSQEMGRTSGPTKRSRHVCMVAYSFYESDNRVLRYAETLARGGDKVEVIALRRKGAARFGELNDVRVSRIQNRSITEKGKFTYLLKLMLFFINSFIYISIKHLRDPINLVHVHSVPDFEVFATIIPKLAGAKIILDIHDIVPEFYISKFGGSNQSLLFKSLVWIERRACQYSDHVIISNHLWRETLVSRSVKADKCTVIMNYPDETLFYDRPRRRDDNQFIIVYPGTLARHQGLDIAIRAFGLIKDKAVNADFHIYGHGHERSYLLELIGQLDLGRRVFMHDPVPLKEITAIMANADLGIVPKRDEPFGGEAFSTKILEFMAMGIPVIVARTKIDRWYFDDSVIKFFRPDDVNDLANAISALIDDKDMRERLARNASAFAKSYSWKEKKADYLDIVRRLLPSSNLGGKNL